MRDQRWKVDGQYETSGGVDTGNVPTFLKPNKMSFMVNGTIRGGLPQCRPGFIKHDLTFSTEGDCYAATQTRFEDGRFQGAHEFRHPSGSQLICSISGRIFKINVSTDFSVQDITILSDTTECEFDLNPSNLDHVWMEQAEQWLVIQDGQSKPLIWNGASMRRSNLALPEVPIGSKMSYVNGRLAVAGPIGPYDRQYVYGNLYGTPGTGTTPPQHANAVLQFTDNTYLASGGAFSVPMSSSGITGMIPIATPNTILGQGPLLVATDSVIFSSDVPLDRTLWTNLTYPIQVTQSVLNGAMSHESMVNVNSDVWFRSRDGIRSLVQAMREFTPGSWGNTPQSHEMERIINQEDERLLSFCSAVLFDNRLLMTAVPVRDQDHGVWHRGLYVLNFEPVSSIMDKSPPAWEGIWTGLKFLRLVKCTIRNEERCFAFVLSNTGKIQLWEISRDERFDNNQKRIQWIVETRGMVFEDPSEFKKLEAAQVWIDKMAGTLDFGLEYRPDRYPCWFSWTTGEECAKFEWCPSDDPETCKTPLQYLEQYRGCMEFAQPVQLCETGANKPSRNAYEYQFRIVITGAGRLNLLRFYASPQQKTIRLSC